MAVQRKKSYNDLLAQGQRLYQASMGNSERQLRLEEIFQRYQKNIKRSKSYQRNVKKAIGMVKEGHPDGMKQLYKGRDRKYSRSTYMGLSKG